MATISNARLDIEHDHTKKLARCRVTAKVHFTPYERQQMPLGLRFRLDCQLWGEDLGNWLNPDDHLYNFGSKYFPDASITPTEDVTFQTTVGENLLDEDLGKDEIYSLLILKNLYTNIIIKAKSNVVKHKF